MTAENEGVSAVTPLRGGPRLPAGPFVHRLLRRYGSIKSLSPAERRMVYRYQHTGLTVLQADRAAGRHGWHPSELWGAQWWEVAG